ncbi:hypothetical protein [Nocardia farcinica]|uniref:hypothetical protein n=1 Tax=Nocardia farcinica TaxID=37329 RepID=UPI0024543B75|nr:hypothetical protein [Nocardia farcinica]
MPGRIIGRLGDHLLHRGQHAFVDAVRPLRLVAPVHQSFQATSFVAQALSPNGGGADRRVALGCQFVGLGLFPLGERP